MTARFSPTLVTQPSEARGMWPQIRVINQNFRDLTDVLNRAIVGGTLLSTAQKTLVGDVVGTIGDDGSTTVEKIQSTPITAPASGDDGDVVYYDHGSLSFGYIDKLTDVLTTRGDIVTRGASAEQRLAVGAANTILKSDGTDPGWGTITSLLDSLFSSAQGSILYRDAASWAALAPGTSGHYLQTQGAAANPAWAAVSGGTNALLDGTNHTDTTAGAVARGDVITGQGGTPKWTRLALGASGKYLYSDGTDAIWSDPPASSAHDLLSATHSDTLSDSVVAGDIIFGNATPKWARLAKGSDGDVLTLASGLPSWAAPSAAGSHELLSATHSDTTAASVVRGDIVTGIGSTPKWERLAKGVRGGVLLAGANEVRYASPAGASGSCYVMTPWLHMTGRTAVLNRGPSNWTGNGTVAAAADYPICALKFTNATTGNLGLSSTATINSQENPYMRAIAKMADVDDGSVFIGFATATPTVAGTGHLAYFRWANTTDTNIQAVTRDGATQNPIDTGIAPDANYHLFEVYSDDGGTSWIFKIDGVVVSDTTTNVPGTTQALNSYVYCIANSSSARDLRIHQAFVGLGYFSDTQQWIEY